MLDALKRLISRHPPPVAWLDIAQWAKTRHAELKRVKDEEGFVIEGMLDLKPWRLEWGPPQRQYIEGQELRLRMNVGLPPDLQMLVLSHSLAETLESSTFQRFTETTQTLVDSDSPEETRWLVMFPQAPFKASRMVRAKFNLVGSSSLEAASWLEGELATQLETAAETFLKSAPPFMVMVLRGRVYLRLQLAEPTVATLAQVVELFETAVSQAVRMAGTGHDGPSGWSHSESASAWQTQPGPVDSGKKGSVGRH